MVRMLLLVLGLVAIAIAVRYELSGTQGNSGSASQPKQRLDNVHSKAKQMEEDDLKRADEALKKSEAQ